MCLCPGMVALDGGGDLRSVAVVAAKSLAAVI